MTAVTRSADGVVTGNTYDKYNSRNPVARVLMRGFERNLDDLFVSTEPESLLDVGCGEGVLTQRWAGQLAPRRVVGIDLDDPLIAAEWASRQAPNLTYIAQRAEQLPFADNEFDLVTAIEVLEHVPDPAHTVAEMARCAARHVLISV
ncbi:MAG TPA: class I SAM-dependent methyltransferase, partial [Solirubrobacteraceae bacterium]